MKVIDEGHVFSLDSLDGDQRNFLVFVKRVGEKYPGNENSFPGTTLQECARAMISRLIYVNNQKFSKHTEEGIHLLRKFIFTLESRAATLHNRKLPGDLRFDIEKEATCPECGHICHICEEK